MSEDLWAPYLLIAPDPSTTDPAPWWVIDEWLISLGQQVKAGDDVVQLRGQEMVISAQAGRNGFLHSILLGSGEGGPTETSFSRKSSVDTAS